MSAQRKPTTILHVRGARLAVTLTDEGLAELMLAFEARSAEILELPVSGGGGSIYRVRASSIDVVEP